MIHRYGPLSPVGVLTGRLSANCIMDDYLSPTSEHPVQNKVIYSALDGKVDKVSGKGLSTNDFTTAYMQKLDSIETGANKTVVDALFVNGSTNPVQSKTIQAALAAKADAADVTEALANKVDKVYGKVLSSNDFTDAEKAKLANIAAGADKTVVDDTLKSDSVNPVQNRVIQAALSGKVDKVTGKGLSTNDFTDELKEKLENLTPGGGGGAVNDVTLDGESVVDDDGVAVLVSPEIHNIPDGGTTGQALMKASDSDYDTYWGGMLNNDPIFISGTLNASTGVVTVSHLPTTAGILAMNATSYVIVLRVGARRYYLTDVTGNTLTGPFYFTFSALPVRTTTEVVSFFSISQSATSMPGQLMTATIPTSKSDLGLGNVDNTSDLSKPISTAAQTALDAKVSKPSSPTVGDVLTWDGSAWVASAPTGGGGVLGVTQDSDGYLVLSPVSAVTEEEVAGDGAVTQALDSGKYYRFVGTLTSLTITLNPPASGQMAWYHFDFETETTPPTLTLPTTVVMPDGFEVEGDKRYEVDILNNYGTVQSWTIA